MPTPQNDVFEIEHSKSPAFFHANATGLMIHGPTPDGMVHFLFYRDAPKFVKELVRIVHQSNNADGSESVLLERVPTPVDDGTPPLRREDLGTISIPVSMLQTFAAALSTQAEKVAALQQADQPRP